MRLLFVGLVCAFALWLAFAVKAMQATTPPVPDEGGPVSPAAAAGQDSVPIRPPTGDAAHRLQLAALKAQLRWEHRHLLAARRLLQHRWRPTVAYALRLAAAVSGVPAYELAAVARCESGFSPFARNGQYLGLFQLSWAPFGLDPYDPVANALSAALTVQRDGGWRQWECKP